MFYSLSSHNPKSTDSDNTPTTASKSVSPILPSTTHVSNTTPINFVSSVSDNQQDPQNSGLNQVPEDLQSVSLPSQSPQNTLNNPNQNTTSSQSSFPEEFPNSSLSPSIPNNTSPSSLVVNNHPMITRGKTRSLKPKAFVAHCEPLSLKQALEHPLWFEAMKQEFNALLNKNTWTLTTLPSHRKAIGCKWVFKLKENLDGTINKHKARLVAKGFN